MVFKDMQHCRIKVIALSIFPYEQVGPCAKIQSKCFFITIAEINDDLTVCYLFDRATTILGMVCFASNWK